MIKHTLYGAIAAGALTLAASVSPAVSAPAAKVMPDVQSNATDVQYYYHDDRRRHRRHHRHHRHHDDYGYRYYQPGPGIYVAPGYGVRVYSY